MATIDDVWPRIVSHAGDMVRDVSGKPFTRRIDGERLITDRTSTPLYKSNVSSALDHVPFDGPGQSRDSDRGSTDVYAMLMDSRVRQGDS